ncbi:TIGR02450 family Trp-rich protein [Lentisphaera marina]|uniref:TIGR02450 family Trp-rich protein n=1 Tax=Lentisphaera marina TaxID=1111041 RepID=UPI002366CE27|nr:TIGR02450 family Trp-rich protein [Lentisphaera marina]MDD7983336.1 TIGR02450 family Trp-rich protein [Lentisphaera marina]
MDTKNILSSKWTAQEVENKRKHFEVVSFNNKEKSVYLKPILKGKSQLVTLEELFKEEKWKAGWH